MKKYNLCAALFAALTLSVSLHAQGLPPRAVFFNGATRLYNPEMPGIAATTSFACSYWYKTFDQVPVMMISAETDQVVSFAVVHYPDDGFPTRMYLRVFVSNATGTSTWEVNTSKRSLPYNNRWNHVAFTGTTEFGLFRYDVNGNDEIEFGEGNPGVVIPIGGNRWSIGSSLGPSDINPPMFYKHHFYGTPMGFYTGDLAFLMCRFGNDTYARSTTEGQHGWVHYKDANNPNIYGPVEIGEGCFAIYDDLPMLCMQGPHQQFKRNQTDFIGSQTAFLDDFGQLLTATSDPFDLWRQ